jgi:DNA polymerase-1
MGLKQARRKFTPSGDRESVEDEVLKAIQHEHPVIPRIQEYKEFDKLRGTYVRPLQRMAVHVGPGDWRIFPNLGDTTVPSARLNCYEPNLLAMPTRTDRGRDVRKGFPARKGWKVVSVDESQIECRIAAHRSLDPNLVRIYQNDEDIYSDFAINAFSLADGRYKSESGEWKYPSVDKMEHRRPSKTCVLAAIYDVTAPGLLEQMPVVCGNCKLEATKHNCGKFYPIWNENNCQDLINKFYLTYAQLLRMRQIDYAFVKKHGYGVDMWGRLLHTAAVKSVLPWVVSGALRELGNFPMQSGAQGTIKLAMAAVMDDLERDGLLEVCHPLLQVHDELLFECREDVAVGVAEHVIWRFETLVPLAVPIKASMAIADNWGSLPK